MKNVQPNHYWPIDLSVSASRVLYSLEAFHGRFKMHELKLIFMKPELTRR